VLAVSHAAAGNAATSRRRRSDAGESVDWVIVGEGSGEDVGLGFDQPFQQALECE
jgi:hypothetical protein